MSVSLGYNFPGCVGNRENNFCGGRNFPWVKTLSMFEINMFFYNPSILYSWKYMKLNGWWYTLFFIRIQKIFLNGSRASPCFGKFLNLRIFEAYFKNISSLANFLNILNFRFRIFRLSPLKILNIRTNLWKIDTFLPFKNIF